MSEDKKLVLDMREKEHTYAMSHPRGIEAALVLLSDAVQIYATEYKREMGDVVGNDGVIGPSFSELLNGFRGLLVGPSGRLACGYFDTMLRNLAKTNKVDFPE
jgi:hypothetical protein